MGWVAIMAKDGGWIGVDWDGTTVHYLGNISVCGPVIQSMADRIRGWIARGIEVRIVTARVANSGRPGEDLQAFIAAQRKMIQDVCEREFGQRLTVTAEKDFNMIELWDDRAVRVIEGTGAPCCDHHLIERE